MKKFLYIPVLLALALLFTHCAQITPLTGGKKDKDAPTLVEATPKNASLNFAAKTVDLEFNEYIVLKDVANQLIITPQMNEQPDVEANGKTVTITFHDTLKPNTTYKLAFGNSITDLRENNPFQNFEYIFSTGPSIDSLKMHGHVINAFDNKPAAGVLISLYDSKVADSTVYQQKPLYISRTNESGDFRINYLPNRSFKLVAIKDVNKNLMYDGSEEMIGFAGTTVKPDTELQTIKLFRELPSKTYVRKSVSPEYGRALVVFNKPYVNYQLINQADFSSIRRSAMGDTLTLFYKDIFDTAKVYISYKDNKTDTLNIKAMSKENYLKQVQKGNIRYMMSANVANGTLDYFGSPAIALNYPSDSRLADKNRIRLIEIHDSIKKDIPFTLNSDEQGMLYTLDSKLAEGTTYELLVRKGAFSNGIDRQSDSVTYKFKTTLPEDYAQLSVKLLFPKKENYIVQLLNDKEQVVRTEFVALSLTSTAEQKFDFKNLAPGNYFIKVAEDLNKNRRFDEGDFLQHIQPEIIYYNTNPIKLLADWEIENEWKVQ